MPLTVFRNKYFLSGLVCMGLLLGIAHGANAQDSAPETHRFRQIEQPIGLKAGVAVVGLGFIGLELWWFLLGQPSDTAK